MKGLNVIGYILGTSGYASHTRGLVNALSEQGDVKLDTNIFQQQLKELTNKELNLIKNPNTYDTNLIITNPIYWKMNLTAKKNLVYLIFEGDKIPKSWAKLCKDPKINKILVPSEHTKQAILNTIQTDKIVIVPHGINKEFCYLDRPKSNTIFLANKGFRNLEDRGGIQYLLKAYLEEFKPEENVKLILKLNTAYPVIAPEQIQKDFNVENGPPIEVIADNYSIEKLNELYNQATVFVSPTRAEAFNLPCLEALKCGLPVITTNFGGQTDFINESNGWLIGGELKEVKHELMYEGIKWLTPNIQELRKALREAHESDLKDKINKARETAQNYSWDKSASLIWNLI